MFDLKRISPILSAKFGMAVTIMVFTSACAHELFVRPSNNDSVAQELKQITPEPQGPAQVSPISQSKTLKPSKRLAKRVSKGKKSQTLARHKMKGLKSKRTAVQVASVKNITPKTPAPPAAAAPAPEIAPPSIPAPLASAGVQTEISEDGNHFGSFVLYGVGALAMLALIYLAPRARRTSRPKRKLVFNG